MNQLIPCVVDSSTWVRPMMQGRSSSNDRVLRAIARDHGLRVHGSLWILDEMVDHGVLSHLEAIEALNAMAAPPERLPRDECNTRLVRWAREVQ